MMSSISNNNLKLTAAAPDSGGHRPEQMEPETEGNTGKIRRAPDQMSKDGDTLELSRAKIPDAVLKGYSEGRLKSMLQNKEISRQQYDKIVEQKDDGGSVHLLT